MFGKGCIFDKVVLLQVKYPCFCELGLAIYPLSINWVVSEKDQVSSFALLSHCVVCTLVFYNNVFRHL